MCYGMLLAALGQALDLSPGRDTQPLVPGGGFSSGELFSLDPAHLCSGPASFHWPLLRHGVTAPGLGTPSALPRLLVVALGALLICAKAWFPTVRVGALGLFLAVVFCGPAFALPPRSFEQDPELAVARDVWAQGDGQWLARLKPMVASPAERKRLAYWLWVFEQTKSRNLPARRP